MAKFCSECGESVTNLMTRCPRCGAALCRSSHDGGGVMRWVIVVVGALIMMSTLLGWYNISIAIDGGIIDTFVHSISRLLPGYSGIGTTNGLIIFALALTMVIAAVCRSRRITLLAAIGCFIVAVMAVASPPEYAELLQHGSADGGNLMDSFSGPMSGLSPLDGSRVDSIQLMCEVVADYITVELSTGVKIALILSVAALTLSIVDFVRSIKSRVTKK